MIFYRLYWIMQLLNVNNIILVFISNFSSNNTMNAINNEHSSFKN